MKTGFGDFDAVAARSKEYEQVVLNHDPLIEDIIEITKVIKDVIRDGGYIIYGGTAIDFALRLKGSKLYPDEMLAVADLDFFSPDSVKTAYDIADMLNKRGYSSRAIVAQYVRAMRVDLGGNHFIADISYIPARLFKIIPTIEFDGMRCVHPDYQRIDLHSSLSFPYDNAPREVIFERWSKDIKRFNMLAEAYPIALEEGATLAHMRPVKVPDMRKYGVYSGFAAYAILNYIYRTEYGYSDIPAATLEITPDHIVFDSPDAICDIVNFDPLREIDKLTGHTSIEYYAQFVNLMPSHALLDYGAWKLRICSTRGKLLSINSINVGAQRIRFANIQYVLKYMLGGAITTTGALRALYLQHYIWLLQMIANIERKYDGETSLHVNSLRQSAFFPSITTYGSENYSLSHEASTARTLAAIGQGDPPALPLAYTPVKNPRPDPFDYSSSKYFAENGEKITREAFH